ncbi:MAG TPA: NAD(P)/FAD-dependent oxidoreductase [Rhodothermales bacterium]|nr:NAD(P)/FAD-dependent oxidoreductase [Rhodothermales bacterium]
MDGHNHPDQHVIIIGGGPAGLTAAYELGKASVKSTVLEADDIVGGISRTANYKGYHFDIGGHRFFTKVKVVDEFWHEILPEEDFLTCSRLSRIYYNKKFFFYPLKATNALFGLGLWNTFRILLSYFKVKFFPNETEDTLEDWVSNRFGRRLYEIFFKTYTEKVWGIPCSKIAADWAAQRIKGLSLKEAVKNALLQQSSRQKGKGEVITTLIDSFEYPRRGPGMMWEAVTERVRAQGSEVRMQTRAEKIIRRGNRVEAVEAVTPEGLQRLEGTHFISSMPIRTLINCMEPAAPAEVVAAADRLKYRDFLTVALIIKQRDLFPDNWIYIHDPEVKVGRIQNFKNWSAHMVPDPESTCLGLEYFCFEGDGLWTMADADLVELGRQEINRLGLARAEDVVDGCVVRMPKAYPVYDGEYREALKTIQAFVGGIENLQLVGRNGMHRYNNQDHSMLTAMLAARNILGASYDLWKVNDDNNYHEEVRSGERDALSEELGRLNASQPRVPAAIVTAA